jgi:hypothetical protein
MEFEIVEFNSKGAGMIFLRFQEAVLRGVQVQPAVKEWGSS